MRVQSAPLTRCGEGMDKNRDRETKKLKFLEQKLYSRAVLYLGTSYARTFQNAFLNLNLELCPT